MLGSSLRPLFCTPRPLRYCFWLVVRGDRGLRGLVEPHRDVRADERRVSEEGIVRRFEGSGSSEDSCGSSCFCSRARSRACSRRSSGMKVRTTVEPNTTLAGLHSFRVLVAPSRRADAPALPSNDPMLDKSITNRQLRSELATGFEG